MTNIDNAFFDKIANALSTLTDGCWKPVVVPLGNHTIVEAGSGLSSGSESVDTATRVRSPSATTVPVMAGVVTSRSITR